jgi:hypothetical protein
MRKSHLEIKKMKKFEKWKIKKFALYFYFLHYIPFLALHFEKIALLLVNQNWEIFSCILLNMERWSYTSNKIAATCNKIWFQRMLSGNVDTCCLVICNLCVNIFN